MNHDAIHRDQTVNSSNFRTKQKDALMNFSYGTLHITGSPTAIDKHQAHIVRHTLNTLYKTHGYTARCANDFRAIRQLPGYLTIFFSVPEGCVPSSLAGVNDVLVDDLAVTDDASYTRELARKLNISHIQPSPGRVVRFALLPDPPAVYIAEPQFRVIFPIIEYLNANSADGKYQKGATPEGRVSHFIAGPREFGQLMSAAEGYEQSPFECDLILIPPYYPGLGEVEISLVANKARWKSNPDVAVMVANNQVKPDPAWSTLPGATLITDLEALRAVVPGRRYMVAPQDVPVDDRLVTLITWCDESWDYSREHGYLVVQAGSGRGEFHHPPVSQDDFMRAVVTLNNYLAAPITREAGEGYPRPFDITAIEAEVRELVGPEKNSTGELEEDCPLDDLEDIE
jgi:hypothetical protein